MKFFNILALGIAVLLVSCSGNSDVLVNFKDGEITRGEFYNWLEIRGYGEEQRKKILESKKDQEGKLNTMALDRVVTLEAKKNGVDKEKKFQVMIADGLNNFLAHTYIREKVMNGEKEKFLVGKVSHIYLRLEHFKLDKNKKRAALTPAEKDKDQKAKIAKAAGIIKELNDGKSFEDLAKQYSEDATKTKNGDAGYVFEGSMPKEYLDAVAALKEGEVTKSPVATARGIYIVRVDEKLEVTAKNVEDKISEKSYARRIKQVITSKNVKGYVEGLKKAKDVKYFDANAGKETGEDIIFQIKNEKFTVKDLNDKLDLYMSRYKQFKTAPPKFDENRRKMLSKRFFEFKLIKNDAVANGFDKSDSFAQKKAFIEEIMISREYMNMQLADKMKISDKMVRDEYDKNKKTRYVKNVPSKKGPKRVVMSFKEAKDRIRGMLMNRQQSIAAKSWKDQLAKKYAIKIDKEKLEGK
jgi:foldase protein PrsA